MIGTLALAGFLAAGQETPDEVYKRLALGDRVEITLRSGATLTGKLVAPAREAGEPAAGALDFTKEKALSLDMSIEYPGLSGTMTVRKDQIKSLRKVQNLTPDQVRKLEEEKRKIEEDRKAPKPPPAAPPPAEAEKPKPSPKPSAEDEAKKKEDQLKKGAALYAKFPPSDWGPDRNAGIRLKLARSQALTPQEREFHEGFPLWDMHRQTLEKPKK